MLEHRDETALPAWEATKASCGAGIKDAHVVAVLRSLHLFRRRERVRNRQRERWVGSEDRMQTSSQQRRAYSQQHREQLTNLSEATFRDAFGPAKVETS